MISVILIWIYMLFTMFMTGFAAVMFAGKFLGYKPGGILPILLAGLATTTWYSEVYSLFGGVGLTANLILILVCFIIAFAERKKLGDILANAGKTVSKHRLQTFIVFIIFILMAYGTSHGLIHYDTGLYHAQSIRWIEEYGLVKGLGNLHTRLAYNSAAFPLTALYSFSFLGQSFHVTAGFTALLLAWECVGLGRIKIERKLTGASFGRFMAIYYLINIFDEMVSPASDYYMVCLAFILIIRWLDHAEKGDCDEAPYAMLAFMAGFIITVKLSGALLILLAVYPAMILIRRKEYAKLGICIAVGVVVVAPYLIRNVLLSGYLLYPSTAFDIFGVDWKIPKAIAESDYREIQVYGRGFTDVSMYETPISEWFISWFKSQAGLDRLFIPMAIASVIYYVIKCLYHGVLSICKTPGLFAEGVLCACLLFWLFTSPLMRYGCLYVYLTAGIIWGEALLKLTRKSGAVYVLYALLILFGAYKAVMFTVEAAGSFRADTLIRQQDYDNFEVTSYELCGIRIFMPTTGDRVGYEAFPSSPWEMDIALRGENIKDGFRAK